MAEDLSKRAVPNSYTGQDFVNDFQLGMEDDVDPSKPVLFLLNGKSYTAYKGVLDAHIEGQMIYYLAELKEPSSCNLK